MEEYSHPEEVDQAGVLILPLSARTEPQLREMAGLLAGHLAKVARKSDTRLKSKSYTAEKLKKSSASERGWKLSMTCV